MTHQQLRAFLAKHDLTQVGAAAAIGIGPRSMRRYVSGEQPLPWHVELMLQRYVKGTSPRRPK